MSKEKDGHVGVEETKQQQKDLERRDVQAHSNSVSKAEESELYLTGKLCKTLEGFQVRYNEIYILANYHPSSLESRLKGGKDRAGWKVLVELSGDRWGGLDLGPGKRNGKGEMDS